MLDKRWIVNNTLFILFVGVASSIFLVAANDNDEISSVISCATGWNGEVRVIPTEWINDDYCDCPLDGLDEPGTEACSGSDSWPGVAGGDGTTSPASTAFQCPQQPKIKLPLSRISDGICDCCDGADEVQGACPDICDQVLREEREARKKVEQDFALGYAKRKRDLEEFQKQRNEQSKLATALEEVILTLQEEEQTTNESMHQLKLGYMDDRLGLIQNLFHDDKLGQLVVDLSREELVALIIHACQMAGEISAHQETTTTCIPLRLAGLDVKMAWSEDDFSKPDTMKVYPENDIKEELASLLFENALHQDSLQWILKGTGSSSSYNGRRLEEVMDDYDYDNDDYTGEYQDNFDDYHGNYDDIDDDDDDDDHYSRRESRKRYETKSSETLDDKEKEMVEEIQAMDISKIRMAFISRAKDLKDQINELLEVINEDDDQQEHTEPEKIQSIDPVAYNMIKSSLTTREDTIMKGFRWAASAKLFLDDASKKISHEDLESLAIGTMMHGNLRLLHVWQILQSILPEFGRPEVAPDTCVTPWANICPAKVISRKNKRAYPPEFVLEVISTFCDTQVESLSESSCIMEDEGSIPSLIPDGYYGYFAPQARDDDDLLTSFFAPITSFPFHTYRESYDSLTSTLSKIESQKKKKEKRITSIWKDIGGKEGDQLGADGELYTLADKCFEVTAGKYTYETCVFGGATQREGKSGGTNLGKWKGMDVDEETGERVMKWDKGAKCWNGPQRSATVFLSCGPETKLISADEPDTCRYVFKMESHIACDDIYKVRMGII